MVEISLTLAGDLSAYGADERSSLDTYLRAELHCFRPQCLLALRLSAASVHVAASATIPDGRGGNGTACAELAAILVARPLPALSSVLGVHVVAAERVRVSFGVSAAVAVAAPSAPPAPSSGGGSSSSLSSDVQGNVTPIATCGAIAGAVGCAVLIVFAVRRRRRRVRSFKPFEDESAPLPPLTAMPWLVRGLQMGGSSDPAGGATHCVVESPLQMEMTSSAVHSPHQLTEHA